jgi:hypothetical protein
MVLWRVHMEPFSIWHDRHSNRPASLHITGPSQYPRVDKPHLASRTKPAIAWRPCPRESGCAGGMELSQCRLLVQQAVFQGYSELV